MRAGKARGIAVTCEVTPHHFVLTDEALARNGGYDTNTKMNPPLREEADRLAMIDGLRDGSIDAIATDHAPHHADEKALEFDHAPFGIVGLETGVPLCFDRLVHPGLITVSRLVELLSANPARILGVPGGTLAEGGPADITLLAPDVNVTIRAAAMRSKSKNTPFDGWTLKGAVAGNHRGRAGRLRESRGAAPTTEIRRQMTRRDDLRRRAMVTCRSTRCSCSMGTSISATATTGACTSTRTGSSGSRR